MWDRDIIREANRLTGYVGVFGMIPCGQSLLTKKNGLTMDGGRTNTFGQISFFEPLTALEKNQVQRSVESTYMTFKTRCAEGRGLSIYSIAKIAEGRVWTGENALNLGLVDGIGGIAEAQTKAAELAGIESYTVETYPKKKEFLEALLEDASSEVSVRMKSKIMGTDYQYFKILDYIRDMDKIQMRREFKEIK